MEYKDFLEYRIKKYQTAHSILAQLFSGYIKDSTIGEMGKTFTSKAFIPVTLHNIEKKLAINDSDLTYNVMLLLRRNEHIATANENPNDAFYIKLHITPEGENAYYDGYYYELIDIEENKVAQRSLQIQVATSTLDTNEASKNALTDNKNNNLSQRKQNKWTLGVAILTLIALIAQVKIAKNGITSSDLEKIKSAIIEQQNAIQRQTQSQENLMKIFKEKKVDTVFLKK